MRRIIPAYYVILGQCDMQRFGGVRWLSAVVIMRPLRKRRSRRVRRRVSASSVGTAAIRRLLRRLLPEAGRSTANPECSSLAPSAG
jgi:hypothetical protein